MRSRDGITRIKCCGMMTPEDIAAVNDARPDYCGFIVDYPRSHRSLAPAQAAALIRELDPDIPAVAVFVDEPVAQAARIAERIGAAAIQLHGHEDAGYIADLRRQSTLRIWQAITIGDEDDLARAATSSADMLLLDNGAGTGKRFDWTLARRFEQAYRRPFLLAGGLTPENIPAAIDAVHPFGIDISSGIETDRRKDPFKIRAAVRAAHGSVHPGG
ncbi:MAG: phosphoribosylanthranilate isomerase [Eggerthellaceae bacterium]|jgi:phosphoribosylanthranilate isomerase